MKQKLPTICVSRLTHIIEIGVEQMGDLAGSLRDPEVLRLDKPDTSLIPTFARVAGRAQDRIEASSRQIAH